MSNYTKTVNFAAKDALTTGDANKVVKGTEIDTEFNNIATAIATKADSSAGGGTVTSVALSGGTTFFIQFIFPVVQKFRSILFYRQNHI